MLSVSVPYYFCSYCCNFNNSNCGYSWLDTVKQAILRSAKKNLSKDNYNKVVEFVGTLEDTEKQTKQEEVQKALKDKEVEQAKAIIASYEANKKAYDDAKKNYCRKRNKSG